MVVVFSSIIVLLERIVLACYVNFFAVWIVCWFACMVPTHCSWWLMVKHLIWLTRQSVESC